MSLASPVNALTVTQVTNAVSAGNTAAATSAWTQISNFEGIIAVVISVGIITGTITFTFETATDGSGTGSAAVVPLNGALATVTTALDDEPYVAFFDTRKLTGYLRVVGTVVTGPALISYVAVGRPKTV